MNRTSICEIFSIIKFFINLRIVQNNSGRYQLADSMITSDKRLCFISKNKTIYYTERLVLLKNLKFLLLWILIRKIILLENVKNKEQYCKKFC